MKKESIIIIIQKMIINGTNKENSALYLFFLLAQLVEWNLQSNS